MLNLDNDGDDSLRAAIEAANLNPGADRIVFAPNVTGTITLSSQLSVTDDLKILGPGADRLTVSGGGTTRVFEISGSSTEVRIDAVDHRQRDGHRHGGWPPVPSRWAAASSTRVPT